MSEFYRRLKFGLVSVSGVHRTVRVEVNGGCDRHLHYSHATVTDGYAQCAISGHVSLTLFNPQLPYEKCICRRSLRLTETYI